MGVANSAACGVADMRFTNITAAILRIGLRRSIQ
jgi:putative nucleotidyltransferase with HDIG domain